MEPSSFSAMIHFLLNGNEVIDAVVVVRHDVGAGPIVYANAIGNDGKHRARITAAGLICCGDAAIHQTVAV